MNRPPAFLLYADEFLGGTCDMTAEEAGGYVRLLCNEWTKGALPNDDDRLQRMAGLSDRASLVFIKTKFSVGNDGLLRNVRLESERLKYLEYREKQAINGAKGGRPPQNPSLTQAKPKPNPTPKPNETQTKPKHNHSNLNSNSNSNSNLKPTPTEFNSLGALNADPEKTAPSGNGPPPPPKTKKAKEQEREFMSELEQLLGKSAYDNWGGQWRNRYRRDKHLAIHVIEEVRSVIREREVESPGGYMNLLWKNWGGQDA